MLPTQRATISLTSLHSLNVLGWIWRVVNTSDLLFSLIKHLWSPVERPCLNFHTSVTRTLFKHRAILVKHFLGQTRNWVAAATCCLRGGMWGSISEKPVCWGPKGQGLPCPPLPHFMLEIPWRRQEAAIYFLPAVSGKGDAYCFVFIFGITSSSRPTMDKNVKFNLRDWLSFLFLFPIPSLISLVLKTYMLFVPQIKRSWWNNSL